MFSHRCFVLFIFFLVSHSSVTSRILPRISVTTSTILDVSDSIRKTKGASSFQLNQLEEKCHTPSFSSSSFSLQLHSRASVQGNEHSDYKSLTLARLDRDSARVKSLMARLDLAVNNITKADLKPVITTMYTTEQQEIEAPLISGTTQGSGEYFTRVGIGNPAREVYMVLDTGSDVNWLQCAPCADCYHQTEPIFEPSSSSSYSTLSCDTPQCKALEVSECRNATCLYEVSYGDGSYTVGDLATETLTIGSASVDNVAVGCGHSNQGLFVGAAGLLGLGGGLLALPSQLNTTSFSYCLVDRDSDSVSTVEFGSDLSPDAVVAPLLRNHQLDTFYYLGLTGISVGGEMLQIPSSSFEVDESGGGGIIIDSGTAVTRLQTGIYNSLRDAFVKGTTDLEKAAGVAMFDTCYNLAAKTTIEVPTVAFHFPGGNMLALPAKNYMIPVDSVGTFCLAFAPTASSLAIIGNVQQQGTRVGFDLANSLIGFSTNKC
ncbi:protein ASPARTIC PROTEASE IN GUARD CELL 1 [Brassica napus]|uniref:protein ASPARTIC PROTEASE IN GUARD CELL 1 n=1 Tax=Brassica napus TaxID=3708 RepID=UPI002078DAAD|nr:protein ASPARTIC PROTEASE IN GUARD CELL 1 [Brassica napus]